MLDRSINPSGWISFSLQKTTWSNSSWFGEQSQHTLLLPGHYPGQGWLAGREAARDITLPRHCYYLLSEPHVGVPCWTLAVALGPRFPVWLLSS